jgi:AGZA family xanthine/uracil permease-like MFS transporter
MLILALCPLVAGFPVAFVQETVLPGAAVSILIGNLFYAWQARRLARETGREDVTALPYGINTVSLIAFIFFIMGPIYRETGDANLAWKAGLFACLMSGLMEGAGAFAGPWLRRVTPRAAMLSSLAGIAITFIAMGFVFQIFASPAIALIPMFLIVYGYAAKVKLPFDLPTGFAAVVLGTLLAWGLRAMGWVEFGASAGPVEPGFHPPVPVFGEVLGFLMEKEGWAYFAVIFPMGLFNVVGSLQSLESAEAAGDRFETRSSLLANGAGTVAAAFLGSPFPTTIYIGHPGWKAMGARQGYSTVNGVVIFLLCVCGGIGVILRVIPLEVTLGILLWIGLIILAQAFQEVPREHALAVGVGLIPSLAAWAVFLVETSLRVAGTHLLEAVPKFGNQLYVEGMIALGQGFLLTSTIYAAAMVWVIERRFRVAALWLLAAAGLSAVGILHAYELTPAGIANRFGLWAAPSFAVAYSLSAALFWALGLKRRG